jgi:hypothetical protein
LAGVAKLAYAADSKSLSYAISTTSEAYLKLPKTTLKPTTGADFSPIFRPNAQDDRGGQDDGAKD